MWSRSVALGGSGRQKQCPVSNLNKYYTILFKLRGNAYRHNISARFENKWVLSGRLFKKYGPEITEISQFWWCPVSNSNKYPILFKTIFMGIISRLGLKMGIVGQAIQGLWPLNIILCRDGRVLWLFATLVKHCLRISRTSFVKFCMKKAKYFQNLYQAYFCALFYLLVNKLEQFLFFLLLFNPMSWKLCASLFPCDKPICNGCQSILLGPVA